eukprot:Gb_22367 [translate_table: standard]
MESSSNGKIVSFNADLIYEILKRVDGTTLANAGCACSVFCSVIREEHIWEELCYSLWPSTNSEEAKCLISSLGGFRKFYVDCFPLVVNKEKVSIVHCNSGIKEESWSDYYNDEDKEPRTVSPSDFVSIVDVRYRNKAIYSKLLWGIPGADDLLGWFSNCPFRIDILRFPDRDDDDDDDDDDEGQPTISSADGLPQIGSIERERKNGKLWRDLWNNIKLSWILVNRREKQAINLANWNALGGQRHWPTDKDFLIRFGSILPARNILPFGVVQCILVMKCRVSDGGTRESSQTTLKLTELSMQLEEIEGTRVKGQTSLLVLKQSLSCCRSMNHSKVLESYHEYLKAQSKLKEEKIRNEGRIDTLCALSGIALFATCCCFIL